MGKVIEFPTDPGPFKPAPAVRQYLAREKCSAVVWGRIPADLKRYLKQEALASDQKLSALVCRILASHALNPRQDCQCCPMGQDRRAA